MKVCVRGQQPTTCGPNLTFVYKSLLEHRPTHLLIIDCYLSSIATFVLQWQSWIIMRVNLQNLKYLLSGSFYTNFAKPWSIPISTFFISLTEVEE